MLIFFQGILVIWQISFFLYYIMLVYVQEVSIQLMSEWPESVNDIKYEKELVKIQNNLWNFYGINVQI